jgi:HEPN domain-containing protein
MAILGQVNLIESALEDLRAAEHLQAKLNKTNRQVLKLIDDAVELALKAALVAKGINCMRRPFPWLLKQIGQSSIPSETLMAIHRLRNRVKHGGESVTSEEVEMARLFILELLRKLGSPIPGLVYSYCVQCKDLVPNMDVWEVEMRGRSGIARRALKGVCFRCDRATFRILKKFDQYPT